MSVSNNRKINVSRTVGSKDKVKDEVKKLAKEKIAEQLGLNKDLNRKSDSGKQSPAGEQYQLARARDVEQAKLAIRNIKELEGQSKEVQVQEAQAKARGDVDRATAKANREIEKQMKAQGKELSRRDRMVMGAMEEMGGKIAIAGAMKIAGRMERAVKEGSSIEVAATFLVCLIIALTKDVIDGLVNILDLTIILSIAVSIICFILSVGAGLIIIVFIMSVSPRGVIGKQIMKKMSKRIARKFACTLVIGSVAVINLIPEMTVFVLLIWLDFIRDIKKIRADHEEFTQGIKRKRVNKKMLKQYE